MDTRTPRTPTGDRSSGYDDAPALSMVKVPSDPAQIIVNHASFRVLLGASTGRPTSQRIARHLSAPEDTARVPAAHAAGAASGARRRVSVWNGMSAPDDTGAHRLLQAARDGSVRHGDEAAPFAGGTQVIPRVDVGTGYAGGYDDYDDDLTRTVETPIVGAQRTHGESLDTRLLPHMRTVESAYDEEYAYGADDFGPHDDLDGADDDATDAAPR
ncbi:hypothetical protein ACWDN9_26010, partial [Streptomyces nigra]